MSKTKTYSILGNTLIMESDGKDSETGTVTVNGIEYFVIKDERGLITINYEKVAEDYVDFNVNAEAYIIEAYIIKHQKMTAWQQTRHEFTHFKTIKDNTTVYIVADEALFVYRADDGTCWRYYTGDETEVYFSSPWYPAEIQPSADHFTQWIISSIEVK